MKSTSKPSIRTKTAAPAARATKPVASKPGTRTKTAAPAARAAKPAATGPGTRTKAAAPAARAAKPAAPRPAMLTEREIATRAYELYARSGHQPGREVEFWLEAERQLQRETRRS